MNSKISLIILLLLFLSIQIFPKDEIRIISSDRNSILIEYVPVYTDTSKVRINNQVYTKIELLAGLFAENETGIPEIPQRLINVGVPAEFGNTIQVLTTAYKEINGQVLPRAKYVKEEKLGKFVYEADEDYYSYKDVEELVSFGDFGYVRDLPVQSVVINPVKFDSGLRKIKLFTRILFRINFSSLQTINNNYKDELAAGTVINFDAAKYWAKPSNQKLNKVNAINSVLATGKWIRFEAPAEGMYRITRSMLASFGIDAATVDPRTIKIYNNSGKMIPENLAADRPSDLLQNAIRVIGEEDGKFDEGDYILFYGRGINFWDVEGSSIKRFFNYYSKENYYWITSGGEPGKRISDKPGLDQTPQTVQTSSRAFADWEEDKINLVKSGRVFLGDDFSPAMRTRTYTTKLDGRSESSPINYKIRFVNASSEAVGLELAENSTSIFSQNIFGFGSAPYTYGREQIITASFNSPLPENRSVLRFNFTPIASTSKGYLDYFEITYEKHLTAVEDYLMFFSQNSGSVVEYRLNGFSNTNIKVFDVTDYADLKLITSHTMLSGGECRFQMQESGSALSKYIAVGNDNFKTPVNPIEISNSNLHGTDPGARYLIITHKNFRSAAERLKNFRENEAKVKYSSLIVDIDQVYNEFGGGLKDPASLRDFLKYAYDNWQIKPEYVLFFASGNYDYKNIEGFPTNFIVTWQSYEHLYELNSFSTDDFFARISGNDAKVDLSTGRITVKTPEEANIIVDKIIKYESDIDNGLWKNLITLVSDDGYTSRAYEGAEHTRPNEDLAKDTIPLSFDFNKIYMAAYPTVLTSAGRRKPAVNEAIIKAMNDGTIIVNFIGHGSPELWTHEVVFEKSVSIPQLKNDKYFFLTAATCDFAYFDIPNYQSAAEALMMLKDAGCIGTLSAARAVYSTQNHVLMKTFFGHLLRRKDESGLIYPLGYISFQTKQKLFEINDQKYYIFGDPLLRLQIPQHSASIDSVNSQPITELKTVTDTSSVTEDIQLKALSNARIKGHIKRNDGQLWNDFNGEGILTVFDSERIIPLADIGNFPMLLQGGVIFRGRISITNGSFSADFVVPKDISYENKSGKILIYFFNNDVDGIGFTNQVIIGGTDPNITNDGKGPEIEIYFDNTSFSDSYLINPNSNLIVKLSDETGLNTTGTGVGHKLEGIINEKENDPIDFTNHFTGDLDSGGKSGEINYKFNNIDAGEYKLLVKAWDVFNNFSTETTYFSVVNGDELVIRDIYNYPNPFVSNTTFTFQQNLNQMIDVKVKVYTIAGRLIREIESKNLNERFVKIDWDGRDEDGNPIANGTYLYKIIVNTVDGEFNSSVLGKLAVIR